MTWWRDADCYTVFFNRDELKTRDRATPPELRSTEANTQFLSPQDPVAGGSWMLTNENGVTVSLLNQWHMQDDAPAKPRSRGHVVLALADATSVADASAMISLINLSQVRPFTLVVHDRKGEAAWQWDGRELAEIRLEQPLTSSSFEFEDVTTARKEAYANLPEKTMSTLEAYHNNTGHAASPYTVRMLRPDAQTWSISRIDVTPQASVWSYEEELPEQAGERPVHISMLSFE